MIVTTKLLVSNIFSIYASTGNKTTSSTAKKPDIPWKKSKAKADLIEMLTAGDPQRDHVWTKPPAEVWGSREDLRLYPKANVCDAIRRYRKTILIQMKSIKFEDKAADQHWTRFCESAVDSRGNPKLHNSAAKNLLELDVAAGRAKGRKPSDIKKDRPEYAPFETKQWRRAVNNERQKQKGEIWYAKRNKQGALRHIKHREAQLEEAGMIDRT